MAASWSWLETGVPPGPARSRSELEVDELTPAEVAGEDERVEARGVEHAPDVPRRLQDHVEVLAQVLDDLDEQQGEHHERDGQEVRRRRDRRALEDRPRHPDDLPDRVRPEDQPAEADHVEGRDDADRLPAGAVDRVRRPDPGEPGLADPVSDEED